MFTRAVRGAVQIEEDSEKFIETGVEKLIKELVALNSLSEEHIISIQFSVTDDLQSKNPAAALRKFGYESVPLFCSQEARVLNSMPRVIRVLITYEQPVAIRPVPLYINGAEKLRPDLTVT